jgi:hypothetical protein
VNTRTKARVAVVDANAATNPRRLDVESVTAIRDQALSSDVEEVFP